MVWIAVGFAICMGVYAAYVTGCAWFFARIPCAPQPFQVVPPKISIIVPARNEAKTLSNCLTSLLEQDYPPDSYEVILVDDHSTDSTAAIAWLLRDRYPNLRIVSLQVDREIVAYKKAALQAGMDIATGEIILQTDADCIAEPYWIEAMLAHLGPNTACVSGPVLVEHDGSWLQRFQTLEAMGLVALGAGAMAARRANLVNGANLGFRREVFEEVGGYEGIDHIASGDDELLLQKIRKLGKYELRFVRCREAIIRTQAQPDWQSLKAQRLRWVSKAKHYILRGPNWIQAVSYLAFLGLPVLMLAGLWNIDYAMLALELFSLKLVADTLLLYFSGKFFHTLRELRWMLPLQLTYIPYVLWVGIAGNLVKQYSWKGRIVR